MLKLLSRFFDTNEKEIRRFQTTVDQISALEPKMQKLKESEFAAYTDNLKKKLKTGATLDDILVPTFALVREAAVRSIGLRPYDVQLIAALAFHEGSIAEQKTGEGKTLSAVPALVLNALGGNGAHLVTVNDYLARRDAGWMAPIYDLLGLSVAVIYSGAGDLPAAIYDPKFKDASHHDKRLQHLRPVSRREAYAADITYGTNNEFGFDYLRDNMARSLDSLAQRGHNYAIVDEVDSILIDEARTPLIISAPDTEPTEKYFRFAQLIKTLSKGLDYEVDEKLRTATLTDHGLRKLEKALGIDNIYEKDFDTVHHIEQSLKANTLFEKNRDYVIKDDQIIIVDEHTGRLMFGRRYSDGLHQAIEAKENVAIQQESRTLATISLQNYFRLYQKLAGMTGTAETEAEEFKKIYNLDVLVIPTHRAVVRADQADLVYKTTRAKYAAIVEEVAKKQKAGQPILIGTKSIEQNEIISTFLKKKRIPHQVLNAKNHEKEAEIISKAGAPGAVTVATNIAGRGVDIVLGGSPSDLSAKDWQKSHDQVKKAGGLHVIGAVRHESRRIDNQLRGRSGRQGDPGSSRFYVSLEDDIMRIFGGEQVSRLMDLLKVPEDQPLEAGMVSRAIETAQGKVESFYFDQRKNVVEYDDVANKQRAVIYSRRRQILEDAQTDPAELSQKIKNILHQEVDNLTGILAPAGITKDETDQLLQGFQAILPLDQKSQDQLKKKLADTSDPEAINKFLVELLDQAYDTRQKQIGEELSQQIEKYVILDAIDSLWMEHLDNLDDLRDGIGLRGYAQRDPKIEYQHEAFNVFETLLTRVNYRIAQTIFRVQLRAAPQQSDLLTSAVAHKSEAAIPGENKAKLKSTPQQSTIGRNDPCPCGSGLKYKKCGLINAPTHRG